MRSKRPKQPSHAALTLLRMMARLTNGRTKQMTDYMIGAEMHALGYTDRQTLAAMNELIDGGYMKSTGCLEIERPCPN